jgi:hypothetical protein
MTSEVCSGSTRATTNVTVSGHLEVANELTEDTGRSNE